MPCPPRMAGCKIGCLHRRLVQDYWAAREADSSAAEHASYGYARELADYRAAQPALTFRQWLEGHRQPEQEEEAA
jgi:hypothetical protein